MKVFLPGNIGNVNMSTPAADGAALQETQVINGGNEDVDSPLLFLLITLK